jgi:2-dehydropantoate 2-reductase
MKISIVGCGAIGSYYGAKLNHAGQEVHFLLRSDYDVVKRKGVFIRSPDGDFNTRPKCAKSSEEIGECDLVLIGLKATANDQFSKLLPPLVGKNTAVMTLQNGLGNEETLAKLFPIEQVLGGLCFVCLNRIEPGVIVHIGHGVVVMGEFQRYPEPRTHEIAAMFQNAGVTCKVTDNLAKAHWEKLVWNIPFNGLGIASAAGYEAFQSSNSEFQIAKLKPCLTTDKLLEDPRWEKLVRELMMEVIAAADALGHKIPASFADKQIARTLTMGAYRASTLIDFEAGRPLELDTLFFEPLRQARSAGAKVPQLERLCHILQQLDSAQSAARTDG